jgi:hypothetical protein
VHPLLLECKSQLKLAYIDDITLGGPANIVSEDVAMIKLVGAPKGLLLNDAKCEAITTTGQSTDVLLQQFIQLSPFSATLLGAPLVAGPAMDACLNTHCNDLERAISRLELISAHDALVLLRASFSAPSVLHTLRSSPCSGHQALTKFDSLLRIALSRICNVSLSDSQLAAGITACQNWWPGDTARRLTCNFSISCFCCGHARSAEPDSGFQASTA